MSEEEKKDAPATEEKPDTKEEQPAEEQKPEEKNEEKAPEASQDAPAEEAKNEATEEPKEEAKPVEDQEKVAAQEEAAKEQAEAEALEAEEITTPDLRTGMTIRVHQKIKEGDKERVQVFQGMLIAMKGKTLETKTITVQKRSFGVMVEKIFPLASPLIEKIEVVKKARVRRSKLYFLRDYTKRLKETLVKE